jgi:ADP-ribose pyrophosphatase YjhB (NUDIX family)
MAKEPRYCAYCAGELRRQLNPFDNLQRLTCMRCLEIVYENPKVLVTCFATWEDKVLWMKRATAPYRGLWTIPAGFMEAGETPQAAAAREILEETHAEVDSQSLQFFELGTLTDISQVYLVFRGRLKHPHFQTSHEAEAVALFAESEVPWDEFAYPEIEAAMRQFYRDHANNDYGVYMGQVCGGSHQILRVAKT